jgi:hypothetical protein
VKLDQTPDAPWTVAAQHVFAMLAELRTTLDRLELRRAIQEREALPPAALN